MAKLTMNSPGGQAPRQSEFSPPQNKRAPTWVWVVAGLAFLLMFTGLVVTTTLLVVQSNRPDPARVIATQLDEPSFVDVETTVVARQNVDILQADVTQSSAPTPSPEDVATTAAAATTPTTETPVAASAPTVPVRLGATRRYKVPNCVDYLDTLVKIASVRFAVGSDAPLDADMPRARTIATAVKTCDEVKVIVEGHSDRRGGPDQNMRLSWFRAQSIIDQLQKEGFDIAGLQPRGFGAERPINLSGTISGEAENRRVQFALAPRAAAPAAATSDR